MIKNNKSLLVFVIFVTFLFILLNNEDCEASTLEVGEGRSYTAIQDAINDSSNGDMVFVYNGTYYDHITVNRSITLEGESLGNVTIEENETEIIIQITTDYVTIKNFVIIGNNSDAGIKVTSDYNHIYNNDVSNNNIGIYLYSSSYNTLTYNICSNNSDGIHSYWSDSSIITNNICSNNSDRGIQIYQSDKDTLNMITNNICLNNNYGIRIEKSPYNILINNTFSNNKYYGAFLDGSDVNRFSNNTFSNNNYGIYLKSSFSNEFNNNTFSNNKYGMYLYRYSKTNKIHYNNIYNNTYYGICIDGSIDDDANLNWWGDVSGPFNPYSNPYGKGNKVSRGMTYTNWLTSEVKYEVPEPEIEVFYPEIPYIITDSQIDIDGNYSINWTASAYADGYVLYENNTEIYNGTNLTKSFNNKTTEIYNYKVRAWNVNGTSDSSNVITIFVNVQIILDPEPLPEPEPEPSPVPILPYTSIITTIPYTDIDGDYWINWTTSDYTENRTLYENGVEVYKGKSLIKLIKNKDNGTYTYKVKSWNENGTSRDSNEVSIKVQHPSDDKVKDKESKKDNGVSVPGFEVMFVVCAAVLVCLNQKYK